MKELDLFFEYEKHDTLEEFILNFESFIESYEDKKSIYEYLLKLFQIQRQDLIESKKETPELFLVGVWKNIRYTKNIISYLKEQLKKTTKPETVHNHIVKENKNITIIKKKKVKKAKNDKIELSDQEKSLQKDLENETTRKDCIRSLSASNLTTFIKYYGQQKNNLIAFKITCRNSKKYSSLPDIQIRIKFTDCLLNDLISEKLTRKCVTKEEQKKQRQFVVPISKIQLAEIDEIYHTNIVSTITQIKELEAKIKDLEVPKNSENQKLLVRNLEDLISSCNNLINKLDQLKKKDNYQKINIHMNILNNLQNYLKHYQRQNYLTTQKVANNCFEEEKELTDTQNIILENLFICDREAYEQSDFLFTLGYYIKNNPINSLQLLKVSKELMQELGYEKIESEESIQGIYYIWDAIRYRLQKEPKENEITRKTLKDIRILFDFVVNNYKEDSENIKHDYLFNLVDYLLKSEENYLYLKKLTEQFPKIINVKYMNQEKQEEHIIIYIVRKFIESYKQLLFDKRNYDVNKDYLKNVYLLFTRSYYKSLTQEDMKTIDSLLSNFMKEVNKTITSSKRKNTVKEDLKVMYTDKFYLPRKTKFEKEINDYRLENQMNSLPVRLQNSVNNSKRIDLKEETTFTIQNGFHAYSIEQKDQTILKIHILDLYDLFIGYSELDNYIYNISLTDSELDFMIQNLFSMKEKHVYPTITYEIAFSDKGDYLNKNKQIEKFKVYPSVISIDKSYSDYHLRYAKGDIILKSMLNLYRNSMIKNHFCYDPNFCMIDVDNYFKNILNQGVCDYVQKNKLPFIYSGIVSQNEENFVALMNHVGPILSRLNRDDFEQIYHIINQNVDEFHYTLEPFKGEYDLPIMNPVHYFGVSFQRILHELVFDNKNTEEEYERVVSRKKQEYNELVAIFNYYKDYVDADVLKINKGKLVKVKKMIF